MNGPGPKAGMAPCLTSIPKPSQQHCRMVRRQQGQADIPAHMLVHRQIRRAASEFEPERHAILPFSSDMCVQVSDRRTDMPVIGPTAPPDDPQVRQQAREIAVKRTELDRIAVIQLGRLVQFRMA